MSNPTVIKVVTPGPPGPMLQVTGPAVAGRASGTGSLVQIPLGPGLVITDGALTLAEEAGAGTVTSVALSLPGIFTVTGSPITSAGTLTAALATQAAGRVFAGPASGNDAAPTFRQLDYSELSGRPTLGTAAATDATAYATAAQGELADSAVQPGDVVTTSTAGLQPATGFSALTYGATTNLDMAALDGQTRTITLTGNITFTTSNRANGRTVVLRLLPGASARTLTFPVEWPFVSAKPASLAANKTAILSLTFFGSGDADCVAAYAVQP